MARTENDQSAANLPNEGMADQNLSEQWREKLAHRAYGGAPCRVPKRVLSAPARDQLYARMFPKDICAGSPENGNADTLS